MAPGAAHQRRLFTAAVCFAEGLQWQRAQPLVLPRTFDLPEDTGAQAEAIEGLLVAKVLQRFAQQSASAQEEQVPGSERGASARRRACERWLEVAGQVAQACHERAQLAKAVRQVAEAYLHADSARALWMPEQVQLIHQQRRTCVHIRAVGTS